MTKEELEKDYYAGRPTDPDSTDESAGDWADIAYYAEENLEKAFKRIAELEKENAELKSLRDVADLIRLNNSHIVAMAQLNNNNVALRKENAELKTDNVEWEKASDKWKSVYELTNNQLTKAKEIIKGLLFFVDALGNYSGGIFDKAEQFISKVEK